MVQAKIWAIALGIVLIMAGSWSVAKDNDARKGSSETSNSEQTVAASGSKSNSKSREKSTEDKEAASDVPPTQLPPPGGEGGADSATDQGTYTVRLRDLEDRVNRLKEQIFRSKARLSLLAETVLEKKIAGAQAILSFRNEMGGSFRLHKASILLDGGPIFQETDESGNLSRKQHIDLFEGPVSPGDHTVEVVLQYKGHGYGIFSYLKGYTFKIKSNYTFTVDEGKAIKLQVIGFEKGGPTAPLEERPAVRYVEELSEYDIPSEGGTPGKSEE
jgi:hypothetical protein